MKSALAHALSLLARREHGAHELYTKLMRKGFSKKETMTALTYCQQQGLQSDVRFAESLCRTRISQGYGPVRIRYELQQAQVDEEHITTLLEAEQTHWLERAFAVKSRKYPPQEETSYVLRQKQKRFLLSRGFSVDTIQELFNNCSNDE